MLLQGCTQYGSKFGKLSSGHRTGKVQFSFQSPRKAMPKNVPTTIQLHTFHILARLCSKSFQPGLAVCEMRTSRCTTWVSKRQRNQRSNCQHSMDHEESKGVPKKQPTSASWVMLKPLTVWITTNWKIIKEMGTPYLSPEKSICRPRSNNQNLTWNN